MTTTTKTEKQEISKKDQTKVDNFLKKFKSENQKSRSHDGEKYSEEYKKEIAKLCIQKTLSRNKVAKLTNNTFASCRRWDFLYNHGLNVSRSGSSNKIALSVTSEVLNGLENSTKEKINALLIEDTELKIILTQEKLEKKSA